MSGPALVRLALACGHSLTLRASHDNLASAKVGRSALCAECETMERCTGVSVPDRLAHAFPGTADLSPEVLLALRTAFAADERRAMVARMAAGKSAAKAARAAATCTGPSCTRAAVAHKLCPGHLRQEQRGIELRPLRTRGNPMRSVTLRLPGPVADAVELDRDGARAALASWTARK